MAIPGPRPLVGVVHLLPLPGAPRDGPGMGAVIDRALWDAEALVDGGADACIVENLGDAPFARGAVDPHVPAAMAIVVDRLRAAFGERLPIGVNVLRNDARAALGVAAVAGADFIRVNVHVGAMLTDQGIIQGDARGTLLYRRRLGADVGVVADVLVKHAVPLGPVDAAAVARDAWARGGADVLVVTGTGTGRPVAPEELARVARAVPEAPTWIGSGVGPDTPLELLAGARGAIVGTSLHRDGCLEAPLEVERVRAVRRRLWRAWAT